MFVIPTIAALLLFVYFRPHEIFETLKPLTFNLIAGLLVWGYAMDVRMGFVRLRSTALLWLGTAFLAFCLLSHAVKASPSIGVAIPTSGCLAPYFSPGLARTTQLQSHRGDRRRSSRHHLGDSQHRRTSGPVPVDLHQVLPSPQNRVSPTAARAQTRRNQSNVVWEGPRTSGTSVNIPAWPTRTRSKDEFAIEAFFEDPNELAWAVCMGAPLAFALYGRKRSVLRFLTLVAMLMLGAVCVIKTQSRSGQLTFAAMLGVYFVRRYKWRGAIAALIAAAPVMLLGGRSGESASESTEERLECWKQGFKMWQSDPFLGVGHAQFTEHHYLTAHSSLVLTLAELGPIGFFLFTAVVYVAFKITLRAQIQYAGSDHAAVAQTWSTAVLASLTGTVVSAAFLSIPYHPILWIDMGLAGALYAAIRNHDPDFHVRFGWRDFALVLVGDIVIVSSLKVYLVLH